MINFISLIGFMVLSMVLIYILSGINSKIAGLATLAVSVLVFVNLIPGITEIGGKIKELFSFNTTGEYEKVILKALGISIIASVAADAAKNLGNESIAARVEDISVLEMMMLALPLAVDLIRNTVSMIQ